MTTGAIGNQVSTHSVAFTALRHSMIRGGRRTKVTNSVSMITRGTTRQPERGMIRACTHPERWAPHGTLLRPGNLTRRTGSFATLAGTRNGETNPKMIHSLFYLTRFPGPGPQQTRKKNFYQMRRP